MNGHIDYLQKFNKKGGVILLMNGFGSDMVKAFLKNGKLEAITEYAKIKHPGRKRNVIVSSYKGSTIRAFTNEDHIHLIYPEDATEIQLESVADAIAKGTIFDDAESLDNHASYVMMTNTPNRVMTRCGVDTPKHLKIVLTGIIGRMSDDGTLEISIGDVTNGQNFIDQLKEPDAEVEKLADHYLDIKDHSSLPNDLKDDIHDSKHEVEDIKKLSDEETIDDDDIEEDDDDEKDEEEHFEQEAFFARRPKKLKPIPRDVIAYITVELNAIQDSNDQAMLAGYTCSKIELVDFYLNCIDTRDDRYIVPHTRQYLEQMQSDLNKLLSQILKVKPINRSQGIWKQNVTLPEGWRG